jgi:hypothetical protein
MNEDLYKFLKHRIEALERQNKDLKKTINKLVKSQYDGYLQINT